MCVKFCLKEIPYLYGLIFIYVFNSFSKTRFYIYLCVCIKLKFKAYGMRNKVIFKYNYDTYC